MAQVLLIGALAWPAPAGAVPTSEELAAMERERAVAERQATRQIESLFGRLCPGRCELIDVEAVVSRPKVVGEITPGFDGEGATSALDVELERLEAR